MFRLFTLNSLLAILSLVLSEEPVAQKRFDFWKSEKKAPPPEEHGGGGIPGGFGMYPLWKFHKFDGFSLRPVPIGIDIGHGIPPPPAQYMPPPAAPYGGAGGYGQAPPASGGYGQSAPAPGGYAQPAPAAGGYSQPPAPSGDSYGPPAAPPAADYGPPASPNYGPPATSSYGPALSIQYQPVQEVYGGSYGQEAPSYGQSAPSNYGQSSYASAPQPPSYTSYGAQEMLYSPSTPGVSSILGPAYGGNSAKVPSFSATEGSSPYGGELSMPLDSDGSGFLKRDYMTPEVDGSKKSVNPKAKTAISTSKNQ